jgi:biotin transport system permease protein
MRALHVQGDSVLHRLAPSVKISALAAISLALFLISSPAILAAGAMVALGAHVLLHLHGREIWLRLRPFLLVILIVALFNGMLNGPTEGFVSFFRLFALASCASLVTATTTTGEFIEVIGKAAGPLERLGLAKADDIGLAIGLVIRFVPDILARYTTLREAHHARGLKVRPLSILVPLIIATLRDADDIAAAIDARGIRRQ